VDAGAEDVVVVACAAASVVVVDCAAASVATVAKRMLVNNMVL
jgi:hypothetical protein